jgi:hypothetical protein
MLGPRPAVWRVCAAVAAAAIVAALAPGGARADSSPQITAGPVIAGNPQVGAQLTASATVTGDPPPTATWTWLRCAHSTGSCSVIAGASTRTYQVVAADQNSGLRVRLRVTNPSGSDEARSDPTAVIGPAPAPTSTPTPAATPSPTPTPTATPPPTPTPSPTAAPPVPVPTPVAAALVKAPSPPPLLRPFPVVRIKGFLTQAGARITLFTVRAPRAAQVTVVCRGADCPRHRFRPASGPARLRPFERALIAGTRLVVAVTEPGFIGKLTVISIRRQAAPRRTDRCLPPGATRGVRCPAA